MNTLPGCNKCKDAFSFNSGVKGKNADLTKLLFVLHRSDSRANIPVLPGLGFSDYESAFMKTSTGQVINGLLKFCNLQFDDIYLTNIFKCLLPNNRSPGKKEYENCLSVLEMQVRDFKPSKIIIFGSKAANIMLKNGDARYLEFPALALDHPSAPWLRGESYRADYFRKASEFIGARE